MRLKFHTAIIIALSFYNVSINAQTNTFPSTGSAGIGTTTPDASSLLEIKSAKKGLLIPRMTKAQRDAIVSPATGLMIYQTNASPGFYYYDGSVWKAVTAKAGWNLTGNAGTNPANNFIGTTDAQSLIFKVNGLRAGFIDYSTCCSGTRNTSFGQIALAAVTTGADNTATGYGALYTNTTGNQNVAYGKYALFNNNANDNTAYGFNAMFFNTTGAGNTAIGITALQNNTSGSNNVAVGNYALGNNFTGSNNTAIGFKAQAGAPDLTNATAIGANATVSISNALVLGNNANVGIGTTSPGYLLDVAGRIRIRTGTNGTAGAFFMNSANNTDAAFAGMQDDNNVGLYGSGAGWGFVMNTSTGNVGIGTSSTDYKLNVNGTVRSKEIRVETNWSDYVFDKDYKLRSLNEVENYINKYKHLPGIPSAKEIENNGLAVGEVQAKMMAKIEELTLYIIELQKQIKDIKNAQQ